MQPKTIPFDTQKVSKPKSIPFDNAQASLSSSQNMHDQVTRDRFAKEQLQYEAEAKKAQENAKVNPIEVGKGVVKGGIGTLQGLGNLVAKPLNALSNKLTGRKDTVGISEDTLKSQNTSQDIGKNIETAAEFIVPGSKVSKAESLVAKPFKKIASYFEQRPTKKAIEQVQSTAETLTKSERKLAIEEGRLQDTLTSSKYVPSKSETRAGEILSKKIGSNPIKNVPIVQNEIKTLGKEAEDYLESKKQKISNKEHFDMFDQKREAMAKYSTESEMKAYDEQIKLFEKQTHGLGGYDTSNYYKALKDYETNVTSRLAKGKEALLTETGSAKLQAAKDVRAVVRDMLGNKHDEFKGKMYDLFSLYDSLDNVIIKAEQAGGKNVVKKFAEKHPFITAGGAFLGYDRAKNYFSGSSGGER